MTKQREGAPNTLQNAVMNQWLIGLDDTDNLDSRGTGFRARSLVQALEQADLATVIGVTRHQLFFDQRIPYTSHNSCACIGLRSSRSRAELLAFCRDYMLEHAAEGSDVGLCVASPDQAEHVQTFGLRAKCEVLNQAMAWDTADKLEIALEGLTGTRDGIIGSLAGVGLFANGDDGRYIWKPALRDLANQIVSLEHVLRVTGIDDIRTIDGASVTHDDQAHIELGDWPRPVRINGKAVLLVEEGTENERAKYQCIDKRRVKAFRP